MSLIRPDCSSEWQRTLRRGGNAPVLLSTG